ncbi:hypothetical protein [Desulfocicer vacuolatum]|nr:hypothetical protein [Desulfocicer vacuolatum]
MDIESIKNPDLNVSSRKDVHKEQVELKNFIALLDLFDLSQFLDSIFYDSGCDCAFYTFRSLPPCIDELKVKATVDQLADIALTQYEDSRGFIGHGALMDIEDKEDKEDGNNCFFSSIGGNKLDLVDRRLAYPAFGIKKTRSGVGPARVDQENNFI